MKHHLAKYINTANTISLPGISPISHLLYVLLYLYFPSFSDIIFWIYLINKFVAEVYFPSLQNLLTREFNLFTLTMIICLFGFMPHILFMFSCGVRGDVQSAFCNVDRALFPLLCSCSWKLILFLFFPCVSFLHFNMLN